MRYGLAILIGVGVLLGSPAWSQTQNCALSAPSAQFPDYDFLDPSPAVAPVEIEVSCTDVGRSGDTPIPLALEVGTGYSGSLAQRELSSGTNTLRYNIYDDAALSRVLGDGTEGTLRLSGVVSLTDALNLRRTIYVAIDPQQNVPAGSYTDRVTLILEF